jgi:glycosidase
MNAPFSFRKNPRLCEIPALVWLSDVSRRFSRPVTLGTVPENVWDELAAQGWDFIWLMGVWERSPSGAALMLANDAARKSFDQALPGWTPEQVTGSPYAVHRYEPDPRVGTWADLDRARASLNKRGIGLMLDFVGNHTALDHPWTRDHPEYYIQGSEADFARDPASYFAVETAAGRRAILAHGRDPYFPPWADVAQLDFFSEAMRAAQIAQLAKIAAHCDGLRCDMAMLMLNDVFARTWASHLASRQPPAQEFWTQARPVAPGMLWLAEVYWGLEPRLLEMGFQFAYDKSLYDLLRNSDGAGIASRLRALEAMQPRLAHFLENHDEARAAEVFGAPSLRADGSDTVLPGDSGEEKRNLTAAAALIATLPGMRFFHYGQLQGCRIHLPIELSAQAPDTAATGDASIRAFYRKLLAITAAPGFHDGAFLLLEVTSDTDGTFANLTAYEWRLGDEHWVIVANPGGATAQGRVHFPDGIAPGIEVGGQYVFADELNGPRYLRDGTEISNQGLYIRLDAFQAHIFRVSFTLP